MVLAIGLNSGIRSLSTQKAAPSFNGPCKEQISHPDRYHESLATRTIHRISLQSTVQIVDVAGCTDCTVAPKIRRGRLLNDSLNNHCPAGVLQF